MDKELLTTEERQTRKYAIIDENNECYAFTASFEENKKKLEELKEKFPGKKFFAFEAETEETDGNDES